MSRHTVGLLPPPPGPTREPMGAQPDTSTSAPEVCHGVQPILAPLFVPRLLAPYLDRATATYVLTARAVLDSRALRVAVRLMRAGDRRHLWGESFDGFVANM